MSDILAELPTLSRAQLEAVRDRCKALIATTLPSLDENKPELAVARELAAAAACERAPRGGLYIGREADALVHTPSAKLAVERCLALCAEIDKRIPKHRAARTIVFARLARCATDKLDDDYRMRAVGRRLTDIGEKLDALQELLEGDRSGDADDIGRRLRHIQAMLMTITEHREPHSLAAYMRALETPKSLVTQRFADMANSDLLLMMIFKPAVEALDR